MICDLFMWFGWNFAHLFFGWLVIHCFIFQKFWFLGLRDDFLAKTRPKLWGRLKTSNMVWFGWSFTHLFLGWIPRGVSFIFQKFWFLGLGDKFFCQSEAKTFGQRVSLETSKLIRFGWNFKHLILGQISDGYSLHFLKILIF